MTYIDQLKYVEFNSGPDVCLGKALVINFDMIYKVLSTSSSFRTGTISRSILFISKKSLEKRGRKLSVLVLDVAGKTSMQIKKLVLSNFLDKQIMFSYKLFGLLFCDFKDKFNSEGFVFTQKYVAGQHEISLCCPKRKSQAQMWTLLLQLVRKICIS